MEGEGEANGGLVCCSSSCSMLQAERIRWLIKGGGVCDCSIKSTLEQFHKNLKFVEYFFRCSHNCTLFS